MPKQLQQALVAIDYGSALKAIFVHHVFQVHKMCNILGYLPNYKRAWVKRMLQQAWNSGGLSEARGKLYAMANSLKKDRPGAPAWLT